jgi:predicted ferric reductase
VSLIAVAFLALHILTSVLDTFVHIGWAAVVVPFTSAYKRLWVGIGTIGFDLMIAVLVTSLLRHHMSARLWRAVHWLVYLSWPVAVAHAFGMGTDMRLRWVTDLTIACIVAAVCAAAWRLTWFVGRRQRALALASIRDRPDGVSVKHIVT